MPIKVLVNGAFGKMGQMVSKTIGENARFELVGQTGREYDLKKSIIDSKAQVVIDFTHPDSVYANTAAIIASGAHPVIGTTGLSKDQIKAFQKQCAELKLGGIIAANFSLGAVLLMKHAREIVKFMPQVEVIEMHHETKADSPSGTAIHTAELLSEARGIHAGPKTQKETVKGARGGLHQNIPVHSIRLPGFLAHEMVIFGNTGETLTLKHDSISRECFMPGICLACEQVVNLDRLVYGLEELL